MAKIQWVFQDEQGENLNRYIATNVNTGERITFDLLRGGNISVVGTPLNAEKLNELIKAINALYDKKIYFHNIQCIGSYGVIAFQLISLRSEQINTISKLKEVMALSYGDNFYLMCSGAINDGGSNVVVSSIYLDPSYMLFLNCYSLNSYTSMALDFQEIIWNNIVDNVQIVAV